MLVNTITDNKKLQYRCASGTNVIQMKEVIGAEVNLSAVLQINTTREDGEEAVITSLISKDGEIYQTLSPTVSDCVNKLNQIFDIGEEQIIVRISQGKSKSNRDYLTLELVE